MSMPEPAPCGTVHRKSCPVERSARDKSRNNPRQRSGDHEQRPRPIDRVLIDMQFFNHQPRALVALRSNRAGYEPGQKRSRKQSLEQVHGGPFRKRRCKQTLIASEGQVIEAAALMSGAGQSLIGFLTASLCALASTLARSCAKPCQVSDRRRLTSFPDPVQAALLAKCSQRCGPGRPRCRQPTATERLP